MSRNNEDFCTACQLRHGDPENWCGEQNGRPCYLDIQAQDAVVTDFEDEQDMVDHAG